MNIYKNFSKKYPVLLVILTVLFVYGLLKLTGLVNVGPLSFGIREFIMAVVVFIVTFIFMGKEKVSFSAKGFHYSFRFVRGYLIVMAVIVFFGVLSNVLDSVVNDEVTAYKPIGVINIVIAGLFVGIVEEFTFRGLIFGGLLQKFGNSKKNIILAAFMSGLLFGVMHIVDSALAGEITDIMGVGTAVLKTIQTGIFGVVLAFIYYKTRNLFAVAALHSLDDFLVFVTADAGNTKLTSFVANSGDNLASARIYLYIIFTLILVPSIVRCIRNLKPGEAIPFDEDFLPRAVEFEKKSKKLTGDE